MNTMKKSFQLRNLKLNRAGKTILLTAKSIQKSFTKIDSFCSVKHLSTLLSEAEIDVARLTEMNTMLKEELRRQERSTEREKQMQNLEYMKNVIFKVSFIYTSLSFYGHHRI